MCKAPPQDFDLPFFHPQVSQGLALRKGHSCDPHLRVSISGARLCFSWDPQAGLRALPQRRHTRRGAGGLLPAPRGWTFRVPGQTMGPHMADEVAGTGARTMGLCFSPTPSCSRSQPGRCEGG